MSMDWLGFDPSYAVEDDRKSTTNGEILSCFRYRSHVFIQNKKYRNWWNTSRPMAFEEFF